MHTAQHLTLARDCEAVQIPSGSPILLPKGSEVAITQSLGGTYTVSCSYGLARIADKDRDALGFESATITAPDAADAVAEVDPELVWERLKSVYDPEIPVNIVDLGLVYSMDIIKTEAGTNKIEVKMTLTAPGCGMGPVIAADAKQRVLTVPGVSEAAVDIVWDPPWNQNMITEVGKMKLGMI